MEVIRSYCDHQEDGVGYIARYGKGRHYFVHTLTHDMLKIERMDYPLIGHFVLYSTH